jgi:UDP-N-acetylenolpyruvoylglucosamine reductase
LRDEEPIAAHLPLRAGGTFERWEVAPDEDALAATLREARAQKLQVRPIPPFHDALPPEGGLTGLGLRLGAGFEGIEAVEEGLRVGASAPLALLGLRKGFEALRGAAGTLADAVDEGWILPAVVKLRWFKGRGYAEGAEREPNAIVVAAWLAPGVKLTPPRAGEWVKPLKKRDVRALLRGLGLAGLRLGGAQLAEDDPAVLVNRGDATAKQLRLLLTAAKERVHTATGLTLEERITLPGKGARS